MSKTKTPEEVGKAFEDHLEKVIFDEANFVLVRKTPAYPKGSERYNESLKEPDFTFRCKATNREFHVEAKFRSNYKPNNKVPVIKPNQFVRYYEYNKIEKPVLIALGIGGKESKPETISLIPLNEIKYLELYESVINKYKIDNAKSVAQATLLNRLNIGWKLEEKTKAPSILEHNQTQDSIIAAKEEIRKVKQDSVVAAKEEITKAKEDSIAAVKEQVDREKPLKLPLIIAAIIIMIIGFIILFISYSEKQKKLQNEAKEKAKQDSLLAVKLNIRNNIVSYVKATPNKPNYTPPCCFGLFSDGTLSNLKVKVKNTSGYMIDNVRVEIKYFNSSYAPEGNPIILNFPSLATNSIDSLIAQPHEGRYFKCSIMQKGIKSVALGL